MEGAHSTDLLAASRAKRDSQATRGKKKKRERELKKKRDNNHKEIDSANNVNELGRRRQAPDKISVLPNISIGDSEQKIQLHCVNRSYEIIDRFWVKQLDL